MNLAAVARAFAVVLAGTSVFAFLFALMSASSGGAHAPAFLVTGASAGFLGVGLFLGTIGRDMAGGAREALVFAVLAWIITPIFTAAPFLAADEAESFSRAYFDAVSASTTTGFRPAFASDNAPQDLIFWWNALQWAGGFATIVSALVIMPALNLTGPGVHRSPLFTLEPDRLFDRFAPVGAAAFGLYAGATLLIAAVIAATGVTAGDAICLAMAGVSTGGLLMPDGSSTLSGANAGTVLAAGAALGFGLLNFALHWDAIRGRAGRAPYFSDGETRALAAFIFIVFLVMLFAHANPGANFAEIFVESVSLVGTAAWDVGAAGLSALAPAVLIGVVVIGASPASAAGGVKLIRFVLLFRHAGAELRRLAHPSSVIDVQYRGRTVSSRHVMGLMVYAIGYAVAIAGLALMLTLTGATFPTAFFGAMASIANAGPAFDFALIAHHGRDAVQAFDAQSFLDDPQTRLTLGAGMVLGRLEVLAALAMLNPSFWKR